MECYSGWQNRNETVGHFARKWKLLSAPVVTSLIPFRAPSRSPLVKFAELGKRPRLAERFFPAIWRGQPKCREALRTRPLPPAECSASTVRHHEKKPKGIADRLIAAVFRTQRKKGAES
jgi:hypothetical protein